MTRAFSLGGSPIGLIPIIGIPIFLAISNQTMIAVAMPDVGAELGELDKLPWLVTGYMLALTIAGPVYGTLGDSYGRARMLFAALLVFFAGALICTLSHSLNMLAAGRLVQGLGGGGLMSLSQALIGELIAPRDRGRAQGFVASIGVVASTLGPLLGGLLVHSLGWRSLFVLSFPLVLIAALTLRAQKIPSQSRRAQRFDLPGFLFLVSLVFGGTTALELLLSPGERSWFLFALGAGITGFMGLLLFQRRSANPLFPPALFRIPAVLRAFVMAICHGGALVSFVTLIPLFHAILRTDGTVDTALSMLALTIAFGVSGVITGNLISLTGRTALWPTLSLPVAAAAIAFIGLEQADLSRAALLATYSIAGLAIGSVMSVIHTTVQQEAPDALRGRASGAITFFRSVGAVLGTTIVSLVLFTLAPVDGTTSPGDLLTRAATLDPALRGAWESAFRAAFLTLALFVCGTWIAVATLKTRRIPADL